MTKTRKAAPAGLQPRRAQNSDLMKALDGKPSRRSLQVVTNREGRRIGVVIDGRPGQFLAFAVTCTGLFHRGGFAPTRRAALALCREHSNG